MIKTVALNETKGDQKRHQKVTKSDTKGDQSGHFRGDGGSAGDRSTHGIATPPLVVTFGAIPSDGGDHHCAPDSGTASCDSERKSDQRHQQGCAPAQPILPGPWAGRHPSSSNTDSGCCTSMSRWGDGWLSHPVSPRLPTPLHGIPKLTKNHTRMNKSVRR